MTGQDMVGIAQTGSGKTLSTSSLASFTATTSPIWSGEMNPLCWLLPSMSGWVRASRAYFFTCLTSDQNENEAKIYSDLNFEF